MDTNQDRLVTLEEFLASTQRKDFGDTGEGWEVRSPPDLPPPRFLHGQSPPTEWPALEPLLTAHPVCPQTVEMHPAYTEEELRRFEEELAAREAELNAQAQRLSQETEALGRSQGRLEAQKRELQQVTPPASAALQPLGPGPGRPEAGLPMVPV